MFGYLLAAAAPLFLTSALVLGSLNYTVIIIYAVMMGCAQALATPARDGLLALVADGAIQRRVVQASMIQFGVQMFGFVIASFADQIGATMILMLQSIILVLGIICYYKLDVPYLPPGRPNHSMTREVTRSIVEGFQTVKASPIMRAVVLQNCAMGLFFMGSYIVALPLVIREVYDGSSVELSWLNAANSLGLVLTNVLLLRFGDIHRQGRALLLSLFTGSIMLAGAGMGFGFTSLLAFIFTWGLCGGLMMSMSRTIMQEQAPPTQRARMMAFYSFSFMGAGPLGALFSGYMSAWLGPENALIVSSALMMTVVTIVSLTSSLWKFDSSHIEN
jgi:MFS family permease